ncbi:MAG: 1-phosphofructokinase family hexose kinase [Candidatus Omnitrophica bacterium]|nr:1-phosphofructokinase family hexose kinase [Candidatus Omnitrophota bacterium]
MKSRRVLTVTLNPAVDRLLKIPGFRAGGEFLHREECLSAGGKGINVSRALEVLGVETLAAGLAGGAAGDLIRAELFREKIPCEFVGLSGSSRTNLTVMSERGRLTRILESGPSVNRRELEAFFEMFRRRLAGCAWAVFSGRGLAGAGADVYARLIRIANRAGVKTALDASGPELVEGLSASPHLLKINIKEAGEGLGQRLDSRTAAKSALVEIRARCSGPAVITLGSRGAVGGDDDGIWWAAPPRIRSRNNVGSGDAFLAGFIAADLAGSDLRKCLVWATACGAANAMGIQPGAIDKKVVKELKSRVTISEI